MVSVLFQQVNLGGVRFIYSDNPLRTFAMQAEQTERVMEASLQQRFNWLIHLVPPLFLSSETIVNDNGCATTG